MISLTKKIIWTTILIICILLSISCIPASDVSHDNYLSTQTYNNTDILQIQEKNMEQNPESIENNTDIITDSDNNNLIGQSQSDSNQINENETPNIYVDAMHGDNDNTGKSWSDAYQNIEYAINQSNNGTIINIADGTYFLEDFITISNNINIIGQSQNGTIIDCQSHRGFIINKYTTVLLSSFTMQHAFIEDISFGACVENYGILTAINLTIKDNLGTRCAGIDNDNGNITIIGCYFLNNTALSEHNKHGNPDGAAFASTGYAYVYNTAFINNTADRNGAAIKNQGIGKLMIVSNCTFINNNANTTDGYGGAIYIWASDTEIYNSTFIDCSSQYGGAIGADRMMQSPFKLTVKGCVFINNTRAVRGGAIYVDRTENSSITYCIFINNTAAIQVDTKNASDNSTIGAGVFSTQTSHPPTNQNLNIENNWFGNTMENPQFNSTWISSIIETPNEWLVLNVSSDTTDTPVGEITNVFIDLTHTQNGNKIDSSLLLKNIPVFINAINGYSSQNHCTLINGLSKTTYTASEIGNGSITISIYGVATTINFTNRASLQLKIYINSLEGDDLNDGSSWMKPVKTIEKGLQLIKENGTLFIANGTYYESDLYLNNNLTIIGQSNTIINSKGKNAFTISNKNTVVIDTIIFENGNNTLKNYGNLIIINSIFKNNCNSIISISEGNKNYLNITSSKFLNNLGTAIYIENTNLNIDYSLLINNTLSISKIGENTAYIENNWWGNTIENNKFNSNLLNGLDVPDKYLVLNIYTNSTNLTIFNSIDICMDLTKTQNGNNIDGTKLPENIVSTIRDSYNTYYDEVVLENGYAKVSYTSNQKGENKLSFNILGISKDIQIFTNGKNPNIEIIIKLNGKNNATAIITGPYEISGNVTVIVNQKPYEGTFSRGNIIINNIEFSSSSNNGFMIYNGDQVYDSYDENFTFIGLRDTSFIAENLTKYYLDDETFDIKLIDSHGDPLANKKIIIVLNGTQNYTTNENGEIRIPITLISGNYATTLIFEGDEIHGASTWNGNIIVKNMPTVIIASNLTKEYGDFQKFKAELKDINENPLVNKLITFRLNGASYEQTTDKDGTIYLDVNSLKQGAYEIICSYAEEYYESSTIKCSILVNGDENKAITILSSENFNMTYGDKSEFYCTLLDTNNQGLKDQIITITINKNSYTVKTDSNGTARLAIDLNPGYYIVESFYAGSEYYSPSSSTSHISVHEANDNRILDGIVTNSTTIFKGENYSIQLISQQGVLANQNITFEVNGVKYNVKTDRYGFAKLNIDLKPDYYIIEVVFDGNENHTGFRYSETITVYDNPIVLIAKVSSISQYYNQGKKYYVTVSYGGILLKNQNVVFTINGKSYTKTTNANGQAYITLESLIPKTYTATIKLSYNGMTVTNSSKIVISKANVKLSIKSKKIKKGKYLYIRTLNINKKAVKGLKIKIKLYKKIYSIKTNYKGWAKLKIKSQPKKYKISYYLVSNKYYNTSKKKYTAKITVKK